MKQHDRNHLSSKNKSKERVFSSAGKYPTHVQWVGLILWLQKYFRSVCFWLFRSWWVARSLQHAMRRVCQLRPTAWRHVDATRLRRWPPSECPRNTPPFWTTVTVNMCRETSQSCSKYNQHLLASVFRTGCSRTEEQPFSPFCLNKRGCSQDGGAQEDRSPGTLLPSKCWRWAFLDNALGSSPPTHMAPAWGEREGDRTQKTGAGKWWQKLSSGRLERPKGLFYFFFSQIFQQKMKLENSKCPFGSAHNSPFELICWFCSLLWAFHSSLYCLSLAHGYFFFKRAYNFQTKRSYFEISKEICWHFRPALRTLQGNVSFFPQKFSPTFSPAHKISTWIYEYLLSLLSLRFKNIHYLLRKINRKNKLPRPAFYPLLLWFLPLCYVKNWSSILYPISVEPKEGTGSRTSISSLVHQPTLWSLRSYGHLRWPHIDIQHTPAHLSNIWPRVVTHVNKYKSMYFVRAVINWGNFKKTHGGWQHPQTNGMARNC